jgi:hypothetical protein
LGTRTGPTTPSNTHAIFSGPARAPQHHQAQTHMIFFPAPHGSHNAIKHPCNFFQHRTGPTTPSNTHEIFFRPRTGPTTPSNTHDIFPGTARVPQRHQTPMRIFSSTTRTPLSTPSWSTHPMRMFSSTARTQREPVHNLRTNKIRPAFFQLGCKSPLGAGTLHPTDGNPTQRTQQNAADGMAQSNAPPNICAPQ